MASILTVRTQKRNLRQESQKLTSTDHKEISDLEVAGRRKLIMMQDDCIQNAKHRTRKKHEHIIFFLVILENAAEFILHRHSVGMATNKKKKSSETSSEYHQKIRLFHQQRTERPFKEHDHH